MDLEERVKVDGGEHVRDAKQALVVKATNIRHKSNTYTHFVRVTVPSYIWKFFECLV